MPDLMREKVVAVCPDRECREGSGQYVRVKTFNYDDEVVGWARDHYERTGHQVMIPFRIYERKGK